MPTGCCLNRFPWGDRRSEAEIPSLTAASNTDSASVLSNASDLFRSAKRAATSKCAG